MAGLGGSSLGNKAAIGMFLSSTSKKKVDDEKYTIQKGVKLSKRQDINLSDLKVALGTENDAEAIRWALDKVFELKGDEIKEIAGKKRGMTLE